MTTLLNPEETLVHNLGRQLFPNGKKAAEKLMDEAYKAFIAGAHLVDTDMYPKIPYELQSAAIEYHKQEGIKLLELHKTELYVSPKQKNGIRMCDLLEEVQDKNAWSAAYLDYLIMYPELISEDWKGKHNIFWETRYTYKNRNDLPTNLFVRYLYFNTSMGVEKWEDHVLPFDKEYRLNKNFVSVVTKVA